MRLWYVQCVREWKMKQICAKAAFIEINGAKCYTNRTKWNNSHGDNAMAAQDYGDQDKAALDDSKLNPHKSAWVRAHVQSSNCIEMVVKLM